MSNNLFSLEDKTAVVLGGAGGLGAAICRGIAKSGASVAVVDLAGEQAAAVADELLQAGTTAKGYKVDCLDGGSLQRVCDQVLADLGKVDILINAVGGNMKEATTSETTSFFDLSVDALRTVVDFNLFGGAILPSQVFGRVMLNNPRGGSIINISSVVGLKPFTRVAGYCAAKAAVVNFTQWLAVNLAQSGFQNIRVNTIAPGVVLTGQNRYLLIDEKTGEFTQRGQAVINHTPMRRFGEPEDIIGTTIWLASDASRFITGIVVPIDGGFSAFSGV